VTRAEVGTAVITMIEIPRFAGTNGPPHLGQDHVTASDPRTPHGSSLAMDGPVLEVVHRVTWLAPAVTKAVPIAARFRDEVDFAAGLGALAAFSQQHGRIPGREKPGRVWRRPFRAQKFRSTMRVRAMLVT
jgi:hypothetical protein